MRITTTFYELLQGSAKYGLGAKSWLPLDFVLKVLLEHSQTCSCSYCPWLPSTCNTSTEESQKILQEQQCLKYVLSGLHRKFASSWAILRVLSERNLREIKSLSLIKQTQCFLKWKLNKLIKGCIKVLQLFKRTKNLKSKSNIFLPLNNLIYYKSLS